MASPTSRLLALLELLQARPLTTGREISDRLGIDARTVRRYIGVLQELGIPVEGQRGVGGGYRIRPGYRLPPLMLGDEEAVVVVLGLLATRGSGPDGSEAVDRRSRRSTACCPRRCADRSRRSRRRSASPPRGASRRRMPQRCCCSPTRSGAAAGCARPTAPSPARSRSASSARTASSSTPGAGTSPPTTTLRDDLRTFRVDRMWRTALADGASVAPPDGFDAVAYVSRSLASVPWKWEVEVLLDLPLDQAARRIPRDARRARRRPRGHAPADARGLARLDGDRPRRPRLRLHDPPAGGAAGERARARRAARAG